MSNTDRKLVRIEIHGFELGQPVLENVIVRELSIYNPLLELLLKEGDKDEVSKEIK